MPTIEKLKEAGYTYEEDGALWFKSTEFGDDKMCIRDRYEAILARDKKLAKEKIQHHIRKTQMLVRNYYEKKNNIEE